MNQHGREPDPWPTAAAAAAAAETVALAVAQDDRRAPPPVPSVHRIPVANPLQIHGPSHELARQESQRHR